MERMENLYDVVVIGGGPAGLTAALYLARARYRVVVVEKNHFGGQITITAEVVNFPGVERTSGAALTETMRKQAESFGAEFLLAEVTELDLSGDVKTVRTGRGDLKCFGVLLATGAHPRMVGFQGEAQFRGRGVAYCATCDGEFFTGKDVFVVGGGFAAAEESVFLTKYARHVTILIRGDGFTCAQTTADAARNHEKITVLTNTVVEEVSGDTALRFIRYEMRLLLSLANAVGAGRMRQATRELIKAYACGVESAALDDVFELLAWNQGIGYFSSEIGPSTLFQAYKLIKQQEKQGAERPRICQMLREKFGEKNAEVTVL